MLIRSFFLRLKIKADFDIITSFFSYNGLYPNRESYFFSLGLDFGAGLFFYFNFGNGSPITVNFSFTLKNPSFYFYTSNL